MIELQLINNAPKKNKLYSSNEDDDDTELTTTAYVLILLLYFTILSWAIWRALTCSSPSPDSRALHLLFCFISPTLYLVSSYVVPDFCP